jgi:hypothetical protein
MADDAAQEDEEAYGRPPAEGERSAVLGFVPQYEVAAALALRALTDETLEWIALLDPTAGRLDDFQLATPGQLDAYQIKWSGTGGQMAWSEIKSNLSDLLRDREGLVAGNPDRTVSGHLYTNEVPSNTVWPKQPPGASGASPAKAVAALLRPASEGKFDSLEKIPAARRGLWRQLSDELGGLDEAELLRRFAFVRLDFGQIRPKDADVPGRDGERYRRDVDTIRGALFDVAIEGDRPVRIARDELLDRLPAEWRPRLELLSAHEFARPAHYEPIATSVVRLNEALDRHVTGYVALTGPPGSGKSTLLSQELRARGEVRARYYAYVRGRGDLGTLRGDARAFLHDLVLTLERGGLPRGPAPVDFDIPSLTSRLTRHLADLGRRYAQGVSARSSWSTVSITSSARFGTRSRCCAYLPRLYSVSCGRVRASRGGNRACLALARKLLKRCYHTLRDLGEDALAPA